MNFVSKEAKNSNMVAAILNSTQQPGRTWRYSVQTILSKRLPTTTLLLSLIILSQTCSRLLNDSIEDNEVDNRLEKIDFAGFVKDGESVAGFSLSREFRVGRNDVT